MTTLHKHTSCICGYSYKCKSYICSAWLFLLSHSVHGQKLSTSSHSLRIPFHFALHTPFPVPFPTLSFPIKNLALSLFLSPLLPFLFDSPLSFQPQRSTRPRPTSGTVTVGFLSSANSCEVKCNTGSAGRESTSGQRTMKVTPFEWKAWPTAGAGRCR